MCVCVCISHEYITCDIIIITNTMLYKQSKVIKENRNKVILFTCM